MKRLINLTMAVSLVAVMACNAWATTGDNIFFSTTNSLGAALTAGDITPSFSGLGQKTLYIWVSSVSGDDITPPDTGITPVTISGTTNYIPNSQASLAANFTITSGTSVNFSGAASNGVAFSQGSFTGGTVGIGTGTDLNGLDRTKVWDSASNFTYGTGTGSVTATAVTNATVSVVPTTTSLGAATGVSRGFALTQANAGAGTNQQKSTGTAGTFLLGQVTFSAASAGVSVLQIQSSTLGIFRGGDGTGTVSDPGNKTSAYNYFKATITVTTGTPPNPGDVNLDGIVNQTDLNLITGHWLASGQLRATGDLNGDGLVNQTDLNLCTGNWLGTGGTGSFSAVPEPASVALLGLGSLAMLAGYKARRRKEV